MTGKEIPPCLVCLGSLRQREVLGAAAVTSGLLAGPHCALTLGEEPKDADNEALPVQPNRRRKASAEERLDTIPDLENTMAGVGGGGQTSPHPRSSLWVVLFIVGGEQ